MKQREYTEGPKATQGLHARRLVRPKHRVNTEFVHFMNENSEIMAEHLAERFGDHRNVRLAP